MEEAVYTSAGGPPIHLPTVIGGNGHHDGDGETAGERMNDLNAVQGQADAVPTSEGHAEPNNIDTDTVAHVYVEPNNIDTDKAAAIGNAGPDADVDIVENMDESAVTDVDTSI
ncbi:hypothetical protein BDW02DRAFT_196187 [Decorospora gaudefroyi]|uniref:Uncharacterized protein n=1 Tax=Decorospora gaudefroyi TaxID=184978 RepID=A0A6A5KPB0_9PLEO|nr:hypothetical protein BDW02DRAFT_196187 [Decorospora gaudefroyi]